MTFNELLDKYYLPTQQKRITELLMQIGIYNKVMTSLDKFFTTAESNNSILITAQLALTVNESTVAINSGLKLLISPEKASVEEQIVKFSICLIKETYELSKLSIDDYFALLKKTIMDAYDTHFWDFRALDSLLNIDNIKWYASDGQVNHNNTTAIATSKPLYLIWENENIPVEYFIDDVVKKFKGIVSKKSLFKLFDTIDEDFEIELSPLYLDEFLALFFFLNNSGVISTKGNKGLFKYLQQHIRPPEGDTFPKIRFSKVRYNAFQKEKRKTGIEKSLKPIVKRYCKNGQ